MMLWPDRYAATANLSGMNCRPARSVRGLVIADVDHRRLAGNLLVHHAVGADELINRRRIAARSGDWPRSKCPSCDTNRPRTHASFKIVRTFLVGGIHVAAVAAEPLAGRVTDTADPSREDARAAIIQTRECRPGSCRPSSCQGREG